MSRGKEGRHRTFKQTGWVARLLPKTYTIGLPLLLLAVLALGAPNFLAPQNLANVGGQITALLIVTLGIGLALALGLAVGVVNGLGVAVAGIHPLIMILSTMTFLQGGIGICQAGAHPGGARRRHRRRRLPTPFSPVMACTVPACPTRLTWCNARVWPKVLQTARMAINSRGRSFAAALARGALKRMVAADLAAIGQRLKVSFSVASGSVDGSQ